MTSRDGTLAGEFEEFRRTVMPRGASAVQVIECRRAFFAGALAFYGFTLTLPDNEQLAMDRMAQLGRELHEFGKAGGLPREAPHG